MTTPADRPKLHETNDEIARRIAIKLRDELFPLRIRSWFDWKHAYTCGVYDGVLAVLEREKKHE